MIYPVDGAIQLLNNWGQGLNPKGPYQSLEKGKGHFCVVFTYSIKQAHEIRNRATTAKKSKKCTKKLDVSAKLFFSLLETYCFFAVLVAVAVVVA